LYVINEEDFLRFSLNRRNFFKILGISGVSGIFSNCTSEPVERIIPYLISPDESIPGIADWYATLCRECPSGCGILVKLREGRPIKVEGNSFHPINRGGVCIRGQTSLQALYNPDRIKSPMRRKKSGKVEIISWEEVEKNLLDVFIEQIDKKRTDEIAIITPLITGSLERFLRKWMALFHIKNYLIYEPISYEGIKEANRILLSQPEIPLYSIEDAELIFSFGADFLETWLSPVEYAKSFGIMKGEDKKGRFVYIGPRMSLTAANADEWIDLKPGKEIVLIMGILNILLREKQENKLLPEERIAVKRLVKAYTPQRVASETGIPSGKIITLAKAFSKADPGLAIAGNNDTYTSIAVNLLNYTAGNIGKTVHFGHEASLSRVNSYRDILELIELINRSKIKVLILYNVNPVYNLPNSSGFREAIKKVPHVISISAFMDDTTKESDLIIPSSLSFEEWGDYSPRKGIYGLNQPLIKPLYKTKGFGDILLNLARGVNKEIKRELPWNSFKDYLRDSWRELKDEFYPEENFDNFWEESLRRGGVWKIHRDKRVKLSSEGLNISTIEFKEEKDKPYTLLLYPSIRYFDGRDANKPIIQEIPDPISKIAWDSYLEINPKTASILEVLEGDFVTVKSANGNLEIPVHIYEGIREDTLGISMGLGHREYGRYAKERGVNPINLLSNDPEKISGSMIWYPLKVSIDKIRKKKYLASTDGSRRQFGRKIVQSLFIGIGKGISRVKSKKEIKRDMYKPHPYKEHKWGMVIDLNLCTGCNACVAACYMENNIPIVGEKEVIRGREMSWIRIERYIENNGKGIEISFIPMLCQQCDNAPCEPVCPVYATYHNPEGLNAQIYNRCVGTRYCSNNCPYKVRRFNWFSHSWPEPLNWQLNPDVTVRSVGVMEKCTFCVQRIREKKEIAKEEGRRIKDGEIIPACAQTCPTGAIIFGDFKDPESKIYKLANNPRGYRVLEELNTKPSVIYLKRIKREI
jgi:molybdopterin-containing oxidoreductase family iron-sulfur binding subunit